MFYETKVLNGARYCRTDPRGEWTFLGYLPKPPALAAKP